MGTIAKEKIFKTITHLNDLTEIHNDRKLTFERAISQIDDEDLVSILTNMAALSRSFKSDLIKSITLLGGQIHHRGTFRDRYHRVWREFKAALESKNKNEIIAACELEEEITLNIYASILASNEYLMPDDIKRTLEIQKGELEFVYGRLSAIKGSGLAY
jgi:uncharacterized protein (TIGR02284 family)